MYKFLFLFLLLASTLQVQALTVKELATIEGVQENEISGMGLVIGLKGTGDKKNPERDQMIKSWIHNNDIDVSEAAFDAKNVAIVNVAGRIPPHAGQGQPIRLRVATLGNAKSLEGGSLLYTKLYYPGATKESIKEIFATAQGPLIFSPGAQETTASVEGLIQRPVPSTVVRNGKVKLFLRKPDYVDADRITKQVNQYFRRYSNQNIARAISAGHINVEIPKDFIDNHVGFIAQLKKVPVLFTDSAAKVRINSKTNLVTLNGKVEVSPFAFIYKDLHVKVQPPDAPPSILSNNQIQYYEAEDPQKTDLQNFINAINQITGVNSEDLSEILKEMHKIGVLHAELVIE